MPDEPIDQPATLRPKVALSGRTKVWALFLLICSVVLGLAYGGIRFLAHAFRPGAFLGDRVYDVAIACGLLAFPARIFWTMLGTRLSTGRWTKTSQERVAQCATKRTATGSRVAQPSWWTWLIYSLKWANYTARELETPPTRRFAARAVLLVGLLGYLVACLLPLIGIGASLADDNTRTATAIFLVITALLALIPWWLTRSLLRYRSTHPFMRTQPEELGEISTRHTQWHIQENQKPLRSKIISTAMILAAYGYWWIRVTVYHSHHPNESWVTPALWTPFTIYGIYVQFRKPKVSQTQTTSQ
jgi:hypothetical protein